MAPAINQEVFLFAQAIIIAIIGVFLGVLAKYLIRTLFDKKILKKIFKDARMYETSSLINKVLAEVIQWIIIISALNYSLTMLGFNFLNKALIYILANIPRLSIFVVIILAGIFISRFITSRIKEYNIENKQEISTLSELIISAAFFLAALEFIGVKATALIELYKVILYIIAVIIVLLIVNPKIFDRSQRSQKSNNSKSKSKKSNGLKLF
jgi:hypothetical protein